MIEMFSVMISVVFNCGATNGLYLDFSLTIIYEIGMMTERR